MKPINKPVVVPSEISLPFWEAAKHGTLVLQTCQHCNKVRHYPTHLCTACHSDKVRWQPAQGIGTVHSWTHCHHAFHPGFVGEIPYTLVTIDLPEGVRALGRWRSTQDLLIGMAVKVFFENTQESPQLVVAALNTP